ncbi:sensor domain-containing protein [Streptomyces sp. NPDC002073]|uniref:sensor domain-containing protein n=1 Tax=Streptomyces sp. NBC_00239 TaxID=2903640 RepID=UPI002E2E76C1|nr:sensor domain-containing protein [Streptomyces sp. NBC_00239]
MRTTLVRRSVMTASAVCLALVATACGSDEPAAKDGAKSPSKDGSSAPAAKALTSAELEKLVLAQGDVPKHQITKSKEVIKSSDIVTDKAECKPIGDAMMLLPVGTAAASAARVAAGEPTKPGDLLSVTATSVLIASYEGDGAEQAVAQLKNAGQACAGGFTVTAKGEKNEVTGLAPATVTGGDEAVAATVSRKLDGESAQTKLVVIRKGNTLVTLHAINFSGKTELPTALMEAQLKKLG